MNDRPAQVLAPQPLASITVTLMDDGNITVQGAINDETFAYGLLKRGELAIERFHLKQRQGQRIQLARGIG